MSIRRKVKFFLGHFSHTQLLMITSDTPSLFELLGLRPGSSETSGTIKIVRETNRLRGYTKESYLMTLVERGITGFTRVYWELPVPPLCLLSKSFLTNLSIKTPEEKELIDASSLPSSTLRRSSPLRPSPSIAVVCSCAIFDRQWFARRFKEIPLLVVTGGPYCRGRYHDRPSYGGVCTDPPYSSLLSLSTIDSPTSVSY